jgi:hypothetical protein
MVRCKTVLHCNLTNQESSSYFFQKKAKKLFDWLAKEQKRKEREKKTGQTPENSKCFEIQGYNRI